MTPLVERWQGAGNVYLLIDARDLPQPLTAATASALVGECGGDGVLELSAGSGGADVTMRIWNPDGSESEACGNGTRMVARWASERHGQAEVSIATKAGLLPCRVDGDVITAQLAPATLAGPQYQPTAEDFPYVHTFVSVGNPHVVIPVDDVDAFPLATQGALLEHHAWFPERANVEITTMLDRHRLRMRVWERGVGETPACGSGACAAAVAAVATGVADSPVTVLLPGGELVIDVGDEGAVTMHGPAERIERFELPPAIAALLV